jgi:flagellar FliJ protein
MFTFRLQRVLELREETEQDKSRALASAESVAERARHSRDELLRMQEESRAELLLAQTGLPRVGHLQQLDIVLVALEQRIVQANESVRTAEQFVADARHALEIAARDRQVLDRLKEKHAEVWRKEALHADRQHMDEIALSRFGRAQDMRTASARSPKTDISGPASDGSPMEGNRP